LRGPRIRPGDVEVTPGANLPSAARVWLPALRRPWHFALRLIGAGWLAWTVGTAHPFTDVITEDAGRFTALLSSPVPERRVEGVQGLANLKHWPAESAVLRLLNDASASVRREAVLALGRLGGARTVPHFIELLDDASWEIRQNAWLGLGRMTAQDFAATEKTAWAKWWVESTLAQKEQALLSRASGPPNTVAGGGTNAAHVSTAPGRRGRQRASLLPPAHPQRRDALRALVHLASPSSVDALLGFLQQPQSPPLDADERNFLCEALERTSSARAIPVLAGQQSDTAAWALGSLGGDEAERALLGFPRTLSTLLALDRLRSTNAGPFLPELVAQMGQTTYRSQPDDVMNEDLQPIQRVGANLIRRSGHAPVFIECALQELEDTMKPPVAHGPRPAAPPVWDEMFKRMRSELKPGFVREDGTTTSQPVVAMCYSATDPAIAPRLVPLLKHPAVVVRVYVALTLGRLHAQEALPAMVEMVREGYPFSDSVALASGKHFDQSQNVRWRGFVCLALGRMGGDGARKALEEFAASPQQPRDIRYCAVVGLGFVGSPDSLPALERIASGDIIWLVRDEARQVARNIQLTKQESRR
jgi:HEAT repeat protein